MKYVLDSNIVIAALNGVTQVTDRLERVSSDDIGISVVVIAELVYGAHRSRQRGTNLRKVSNLRERFTILPVSVAVAERYGVVRASLQDRGVTKSDFDLIIACTAIQHACVLVTNDQAFHDHAIQELVVENWLMGPR